MDSPPTPPRRRWPQYSLLNLILVLALCGAVYGLFALRSENDALREKLRVAQGELDALNIYDASMVWGRTVRAAKNEWRWRLYFPSEQKYRMQVQAKFDPQKSSQNLAAEVVLGPGEATILADIEEEDDGGSVLTIRFPEQTFHFFLDDHYFWTGKGYGTLFGGLSDSATSSEAGSPVKLLEWTPAVLGGSAVVSERNRVQALSITLEPAHASITPASFK